MDYCNNEMPQLLNDFLIYVETIKGKSEKTASEYFYDLRLLFRHLMIQRNLVSQPILLEDIKIKNIDHSFIREITLEELYEFIKFIKNERGNTERTRARKVASIKAFFNYLHDKRKITPYNLGKELETPKFAKLIPNYLDNEQSIQLLNSIDGRYPERDYAIIMLFLNCGMRLAELVNINMDNINKDTIKIMGKGKKERFAYLNKPSLDALNNYLQVRPSTELMDENALFLSERKKRINRNTVQKLVKKYIKKAELDTKKFSTHKLRHTAATLMYKHGKVDIRILQEILGHESISTTQGYTHADNAQIKEATQKHPSSNWDVRIPHKTIVTSKRVKRKQ